MRAARVGLLLQGAGLLPVLAFVITGQTADVSVWYAATVIGLAGCVLMLAGVALDLIGHVRTARGGR